MNPEVYWSTDFKRGILEWFLWTDWGETGRQPTISGKVHFASGDAMRSELSMGRMVVLQKQGKEAFEELYNITPDRKPAATKDASVAVLTADAVPKFSFFCFPGKTLSPPCLDDFGRVVREAVWDIADVLLAPPSTPMVVCLRVNGVGPRVRAHLRGFWAKHGGIAFSCGHVRSDPGVADAVYDTWQVPCGVCGDNAYPEGAPAVHIVLFLSDVFRMVRAGVLFPMFIHQHPKKDTLAARAAAAITRQALDTLEEKRCRTQLEVKEELLRITGEHGGRARLLREEELQCTYSLCRAYEAPPAGKAKKART